jgi:hypothetical protein
MAELNNRSAGKQPTVARLAPAANAIDGTAKPEFANQKVVDTHLKPVAAPAKAEAVNQKVVDMDSKPEIINQKVVDMTIKPVGVAAGAVAFD